MRRSGRGRVAGPPTGQGCTHLEICEAQVLVVAQTSLADQPLGTCNPPAIRGFHLAMLMGRAVGIGAEGGREKEVRAGCRRRLLVGDAESSESERSVPAHYTAEWCAPNPTHVMMLVRSRQSNNAGRGGVAPVRQRPFPKHKHMPLAACSPLTCSMYSRALLRSSADESGLPAT